jgi:hypothetical protein
VYESEAGLANGVYLRVWLWLFFKVLLTQKSMPVIFFIFKKLFLRSAYQNDLKT